MDLVGSYYANIVRGFTFLVVQNVNMTVFWGREATQRFYILPIFRKENSVSVIRKKEATLLFG